MPEIYRLQIEIIFVSINRFFNDDVIVATAVFFVFNSDFFTVETIQSWTKVVSAENRFLAKNHSWKQTKISIAKQSVTTHYWTWENTSRQ